jgi:hypothetical protein
MSLARKIALGFAAESLANQTIVDEIEAKLPDGLYPFLDELLPLSELMIVEASPKVDAILKAQAAAAGIGVPRGCPLEVRFSFAAYPEAAFLVYWPEGDFRAHVLVSRDLVPGSWHHG